MALDPLRPLDRRRPRANIPVVEVTVVALIALVLANLVAAIPGRIAARTPAGLLLRAE